MCGDFRLFENITFQIKTVVATFGATFGKLWATFYFNIWSHWPLARLESIFDFST